jgi:hypothetical protein
VITLITHCVISTTHIFMQVALQCAAALHGALSQVCHKASMHVKGVGLPIVVFMRQWLSFCDCL